ncbi:MAG TPA: hypothetical protein VM942_10840 [Acidimicrobiales bacterium]|nr:hypothetical protein [Acidimicrobiales bacterium]
MTSNQPPVPPAENAAKDAAVLEREGVEGELMQQDRSQVGEQISDVDTGEEN